MATVIKKDNIQRQLNRFCRKMGIEAPVIDPSLMEMSWDWGAGGKGGILYLSTTWEYNAKTLAQLHQLTDAVSAKGFRVFKTYSYKRYHRGLQPRRYHFHLWW